MHGGFDLVAQQCPFRRLDVLEGMVAVIELRVIATDITIWRPPTAGYQIILRRVDGDAVQPCIERTVTAKVSKRSIGFYERLLSDILSLVSVVHESHDQT